jgi:hypothetical protein
LTAEWGSPLQRITLPFIAFKSWERVFTGMTKYSTKRFAVTIFFLGLFALGFLILDEFEIELPLNSVACNYSSTEIWLTVTESGFKKANSLPPGDCTSLLTQDAEAIWGQDCSTDPCGYQAWKVGAGRFEVYDDADSPTGFVLRIKGWGAAGTSPAIGPSRTFPRWAILLSAEMEP